MYVLAAARDSRALFEEAVIAAKAAGSTFSADLVPDIMARFDRTEDSIATATTKSQIESLADQASAAAQLRAYLAPAAELEMQGLTALDTMAQWGVPASAIDTLRQGVLPKLACPDADNAETVSAARGALHTILSEYHSWSSWLDEYHAEMPKVAYLLTGLIVASLCAAIFLLARGFIVLGLLSAGASGALVSVIAKLPALVVTGDSAPYRRDIWRRVCTGLAASAVGCRFLVSGLLPISLPYGSSFFEILEGCSRLAPAATPAAIAASGGCDARSTLILIAVLMLFGLSERALTSLEQRVFPAKS